MLTSGENANATLAANKALVRRFLTAAGRHEIDACMTMTTSDATWWIASRSPRANAGGTLQRAQIETLLRGMSRAVPAGLALEVRQLTAEDDRVAAEVLGRGLWRRGTPYENTYHFAFTIRDHKIHSVHEYMDTLYLDDVLQQESAIRATVV